MDTMDMKVSGIDDALKGLKKFEKDSKATVVKHGTETLVSLNEKAFKENLAEKWKSEWGDRPEVRLKKTSESTVPCKDGSETKIEMTPEIGSEDKETIARVEKIWNSFIRQE